MNGTRTHTGDDVASSVFRPVERCIGVSNQRVQGTSWIQFCDAHRNLDGNLNQRITAVPCSAANRDSDAFANCECLFLACSREQHCKLIAAVANQQIARTKLGAQDFRNGRQCTVSGDVTEHVVELLKVIDVNHHHCNSLAFFNAVLDF